MVCVLLGTGFEEIEALTPCDLLRRAGLEVALVGVSGREVTGSHGIAVKADLLLEELDFDSMEMLVLPGGLRGVASLLDSEAAMELVKKAWAAEKYLAAICAAPTILAKLGILADSPAVCYPGKEPEMGKAQIIDSNVVQHNRLITGRAAGAAVDFALCLISELKSPEEAARIARQIVYQQTANRRR